MVQIGSSIAFGFLVASLQFFFVKPYDQIQFRILVDCEHSNCNAFNDWGAQGRGFLRSEVVSVLVAKCGAAAIENGAVYMRPGTEVEPGLFRFNFACGSENKLAAINEISGRLGLNQKFEASDTLVIEERQVKTSVRPVGFSETLGNVWPSLLNLFGYGVALWFYVGWIISLFRPSMST